MKCEAVETLKGFLVGKGTWVAEFDDALRDVLAEIERLRAESVTERRFTDDYIKLLHKAEAKIEAALAKSAAYPVTCPSCGYGWRAGLTSMARTLRGGDDGK